MLSLKSYPTLDWLTQNLLSISPIPLLAAVLSGDNLPKSYFSLAFYPQPLSPEASFYFVHMTKRTVDHIDQWVLRYLLSFPPCKEKRMVFFVSFCWLLQFKTHQKLPQCNFIVQLSYRYLTRTKMKLIHHTFILPVSLDD